MKNYKKLYALLAIAVIFSIALAGCQSGGAFDSMKSSNMSADNYDGGNYYDYEREEAAYIYDVYESGSDKFLQVAADSSAGVNLPAERKIIRDANVTVEVDDVEKSYDNILAYLTGFGGYEANRNMQIYGEDNTRINATFKIPAAKLDMFLLELKKEGDIISSNISSNDITDQYYDSKIRLGTLEKTLENYYRFLENAKDVDEQLRVTRYINDITYEIEQIKGSLKRWDSLVDYSTVSLYLYKHYEAPKPTREIKWDSLSLEDMGWFIKESFVETCSVIVNIFQRIIIFIVGASPVLVPIAVIVLLIIRKYKKKKKLRNQDINVNPAENLEENAK